MVEMECMSTLYQESTEKEIVANYSLFCLFEEESPFFRQRFNL